MMTELCQYLKNWFNRKPDGESYTKWMGTFTITGGVIDGVELAEGQYYRIMGSLFNDGVHKAGDELTDETFDGEVWSMAVPPAVVTLAQDIATWKEKHGEQALSPYQSESFGGYSYTKATSASGGMATDWRDVFGPRLAIWRKI